MTAAVRSTMRVLDLFSGKGGFSRAFAERGHDLVTVDRAGSVDRGELQVVR